MLRYKRIFFILFLGCVFIILAFSYWANMVIINNSKQFITDDITKVKPFKVGLLLGTSKYLKSGKQNAYFFNRIEATISLFKNHKISYIIISGDNSKSNYNEPLDMKNELLKSGITEDQIFLDYAGFRTFDSMIRAKEIFGQDSLLIISQEFHNQRAVFIARECGIYAYAYNAKDVNKMKGFKTKIREFFARDKVFIDQFFNTKPKFLGEQIYIP